MKAEHRKELQTNLLADRLGKLAKGIQSPQSTPIALWVLGLLAVAVLVGWYFSTGTSKANSQLWADLEEDTYNKDLIAAEDSFKKLSQDSPRTMPGRTARFQRARLLLPSGLEELGSSQRDFAAKRVGEARSLYRQLSGECPDEPLLAQEALMGAAKAEEALAGVSKDDKPEEAEGSLDEALKLYRQLADKYPDSYLGKKAKERVRLLVDNKTRPEIQSFYDDMRKRALTKTNRGVDTLRSPHD